MAFAGMKVGTLLWGPQTYVKRKEIAGWLRTVVGLIWPNWQCWLNTLRKNCLATWN